MAVIDRDFINKVYEIVGKIPKGKVATYGQIAEILGDVSLARDVGHIMSRVPPKLKLPCHRVVNQTGKLAPDYVFGGEEKQRGRLEEEGITFRSDGKIFMERHLWGAEEQLTLDL